MTTMDTKQRIKMLDRIRYMATLARRGASPATPRMMLGAMLGFAAVYAVITFDIHGGAWWIVFVFPVVGGVLGWRLAPVKNAEVEMFRLLSEYSPTDEGRSSYAALQAAAEQDKLCFDDVIRWVDNEASAIRPPTRGDLAREAFARTKRQGAALSGNE